MSQTGVSGIAGSLTHPDIWYLSEPGNHRVIEYNRRSGEKKVLVSSPLESPHGLELDTSGHFLFITDPPTHSLYRLELSTNDLQLIDNAELTSPKGTHISGDETSRLHFSLSLPSRNHKQNHRHGRIHGRK